MASSQNWLWGAAKWGGWKPEWRSEDISKSFAVPFLTILGSDTRAGGCP